VSTELFAGTLSSDNGIVLREGRTLSASSDESGMVEGAFRNDGQVTGPAVEGRQLTFAGGVTGTGTFTGNVRFQGGLAVEMLVLRGAKVVYDDASGTPLVTSGLSIDESSQLDLLDHEMIVGGTSETRATRLAAIIESIRTGRNAHEERWKGNGITSSAVADDPLTALAVALRDDDVIIKYTWNSDANLDGLINIDDYVQIDTGYLARPEDPTYAQGDFNYDGRIDIDDYVLIDTAYLGQGAPLVGDFPRVAVAVPEPSALVSIGVMVGAMAARRRRR
jgi:hypothetical protein